MNEFILLIPGLGVLISALVNILKTFGLVQDGQAGNWVKIIQSLLFVLFLSLPVFGVDLDWMGIDARFQSVGDFLGLISAFFISVGSSDIFHKIFKGTPVIGKSFSYDRENGI